MGRFNGFHSYALCCRTKFDKGRKRENMLTYGQDRRAYQEWSDGDYNLANRLMGEYKKQIPIKRFLSFTISSYNIFININISLVQLSQSVWHCP